MSAGRVSAPWAAALLPIFLAAGTFKSSPVLEQIPGDLTVLAAALIAVLALHALLGRLAYGPSPRALGWAALLYGSFALGLLGASLDLDYTSTKVPALFALTLGCAFAGSVLLVFDERRRTWLVRGTLAAGLFTLLLYYLAPTSDVALAGRAALEGSSTIAPGRFAGAALIVIVVWLITARPRPLLVIGACIVGLLLVRLTLDTGSRGPLVAVGLGLLALLPVRLTGRRLSRTLAALGVFAAAAWYYYANASTEVQERFQALLANDRGRSVNLREYMWDRAWEVAQDHPFGIGWGNLSEHLGGVSNYPHNILLEVAAEAGWIAGAGLIVVVLAAYRRVYRHARATSEPASLALIALLTFWVANAMVSGDVNDNRGVFIFAGACLAIARSPAPGGRQPGRSRTGQDPRDEPAGSRRPLAAR